MSSSAKYLLAMLLCAIGSFLALFGELIFDTRTLSLDYLDFVALGLAILASIGLAGYFILSAQMEDAV